MPNCDQALINFPPLKRRKIEANFSGGDVTSDGGALLLRAVDRRLGLLKAVDNILPDPRDSRYIEHSQLSLLRQRTYGLCLGYEDLNDHTELRDDAGFQTAINQDQCLASQATLCRLENRMGYNSAIAIHRVIVDQFIASFDSAPNKLILDFDATDDPLHGDQEGRFFHGYYDRYCFLPLYVFCGDQLLVSYLRPSNIDGARHAWAILALLVKRLRQSWPQVKIIFRGDGGFCRHKMLSWCERKGVDYIVGLAKNSRLLAAIADEQIAIAETYQQHQQPVRQFKALWYRAGTWSRTRRVIAKIEHLSKGANPRFIVTNLPDDGALLYEKIYCARGDMENRIKEQQMGLFADRTSAHYWWPNQFRLLLSSLAYLLMDGIRRLALKNTELAHAQMTTIRLKLFKIGAIILRNTRRIRFLLSSAYPYQSLFHHVAKQLALQ